MFQVLFVNVAVPAEYVPPLTNISVNADTLKVPPVLFANV
jgi:hypothetical protein